jgi:hypothetical protein
VFPLAAAPECKKPELYLGGAFGWILGDRYRGNLFRDRRLPCPETTSSVTASQPTERYGKRLFFSRVCAQTPGFTGWEKRRKRRQEWRVMGEWCLNRNSCSRRYNRDCNTIPGLHAACTPLRPHLCRSHLLISGRDCNTCNKMPRPYNTTQLMRRLDPSPPAPHFCGSDLIATSRCTATLQQPLQLTVAATTSPADTPPTRALFLATAAR